jgi:hypothetical protein
MVTARFARRFAPHAVTPAGARHRRLDGR